MLDVPASKPNNTRKLVPILATKFRAEKNFLPKLKPDKFIKQK